MNIVISSKSFDHKSRYLDKLKQYDIVFNNLGHSPNEHELLSMVNKNTIGIIAGTEQITKSVIDKSPNLKVISRYGSGLDNIDINYAQSKNIKVISTTKQTLAVAEFTVAMMLYLMKIRFEHKSKGNLLSYKDIGIVGYGNIGKEVARLLQPFNCCIHIHDIKYDHSIGLQEIFEYCDIVTVHLPLTKDTYHLIGQSQFKMANRHLILINTSRGGIVDEYAIYKALKDGQISGAAIDVFEKEQYRSLIQNMGNTIVTPHIASYTHETRDEMECEAITNLLGVLNDVGKKRKKE